MSWKDYKTAEDRLNQSCTNDWYIIPVVILFGIMAGIALLGADNVIEVASELISKW